ncbi:MAG: hypothetical protein JNK87_07495 [Bryobacterales bacterium]|nr:hypothetical protein [Bryobacterales bacterium]
MTRPTTVDQIPKDLAEWDQWAHWDWEWSPDKEKWQKPCFRIDGVRAGSTDPAILAPINRALATLNGRARGLSFVLTEQDPYCGIDLDHCLDANGTIKPWAVKLLAKFPFTYIEITPSGDGLRVWVRADLMPLTGGRGRSKLYHDGKVEVYDRGRHFTFTGRPFRGAPLEIEDHQAEVEWLLREIGALTADGSQASTEKQQPAWPHLTGEELEQALRKVQALRQEDPQFNALWNGGFFRSKDGRDDPSGGDLSVCNKLAYHLEMSAAEIDAVFRQSERMRAKWDNVHHSDGTTYGQGTITKAVDWARRKLAERGEEVEAGARPEAQQSNEAGNKTTKKKPAVEARTKLVVPKTMEELNMVAIFRDNGVQWARFVKTTEQFFGYTVDGRRVTWLASEHLLKFDKSQAYMFNDLGVTLPTPPLRTIKTTWEPIAAAMRKLASEVHCSDGANEVSELLPLAFERAGRRARPQTKDDLLAVLATLRSWVRDPYADMASTQIAPPCVFLWDGRCFVHSRVFREWASLPKVTSRFMAMRDVGRDLEGLGFSMQRQFSAGHGKGRIQADLWIGPADILRFVPDLDADNEVEWDDGVTDVTAVTA